MAKPKPETKPAIDEPKPKYSRRHLDMYVAHVVMFAEDDWANFVDFSLEHDYTEEQLVAANDILKKKAGMA